MVYHAIGRERRMARAVMTATGSECRGSAVGGSSRGRSRSGSLTPHSARRGQVDGPGSGVVVAVLIAALGLAGCAAPAPPATETPAVMTGAGPECATDLSGDYWRPAAATADAGAVFTFGTGSRGVLLLPQSDGDICQWLPQGRRLAAAGYRVSMINWDIPYETPVINATQRLWDLGAVSVVLVGASRGGAYALGLAGRLQPAGVVSLSGEATLGELDNLALVRAYSGPLLLVGSEEDPYTPGEATRRLARSHPGAEEVIILEGASHGLALLADADVSAAVDRFLERHAR